MLHTSSLLTRVIKMATPMMGGRFLYYITTFIGMIFLSQLGPHALAGSALISATQTFVLIVLTAPLFVVGAIVGRHYASQQSEEIGHIVRQSLSTALFLSIPILIIFYHIDYILFALGQDSTVINITHQFCSIYLIGVVPVMLCAALQQFFMGINRQRLTLYASYINLIIFTLSAYPLILGFGSFEGFGIRGLAISNITSSTANMFFLFFHAIHDQRYQSYRLLSRDFSHTQYIKQIFKLGLPFAVQVGAELSAYFFAVIIVGWISLDALAITQILSQYGFLLVIPIFGLSQTAAVLVSQAIGRKDVHELQPITRICLMIAYGCLSCAAIAFIFFPHTLAIVFLGSDLAERADLFQLLRLLFALKILDLFFDATRNILTGALRGLYDTKTPMITSLFSNWVCGIPLGYCLAIPLHFGIVGIYLSFLVGNMISTFLLLKRWKQLSAYAKKTRNDYSPRVS